MKRKKTHINLWRDPRTGMLYYRTKIDGKVWKRSCETRDEDEAQPIAEKHHRTAELLRAQPQKSLNLEAAIVAEVAKVEQDVSASQAERVSTALMNFLVFAGNVTLDQIDTAKIERYQRKRLNEPRKVKRRKGKETIIVELPPACRSTVEKEICFLLRLLRRNGFRPERPSPKAGNETEVREFTQDELGRFFTACPPRYQVLFLFMLSTGAREEEVLPSPRSAHTALLKSEVDLERGYVTLRSAKQRRSGKRARPRVLPIPEDLIEPLRAHMATVPGEFVFQREENIRRVFDQTLVRADIPKRNALGQILNARSSFRHTYATIASEFLGHNALMLTRHMGHSNIATTLRYSHPESKGFVVPLRELAGPTATILDIEVGGVHKRGTQALNSCTPEACKAKEINGG